MKAIVYYGYGSADVLQYQEVEKPVPEDDQVLIRVRAAALNPLDRHLVKKKMPAILRKRLKLPEVSATQYGLIGRDVSGEIETIGANVSQFKPGDQVFGSCVGACAEYACARESRLALKPANVSFEEAASTPVAIYTALQGLRKGLIQPGCKVLINGAAGGVGTFAVQIAKYLEAEVAGVCSTGGLDVVRSIGADRVIDYTKQDFTEIGDRYDLVFDCAWEHSWTACKRILNPNGRYVIVGGTVNAQVMRLLVREIMACVSSSFTSRKCLMFMAKSDQEDLVTIRDLMAEGKVKPVIDKCFPLSQTQDAVRHMEGGHARGKVVITVV